MEYARGQWQAAAAGLQPVADERSAPKWLRAQALLMLGRIADLQNQRDQALRHYKRVVSDYERTSAAQPARLGLLAPYRRAGIRAL